MNLNLNNQGIKCLSIKKMDFLGRGNRKDETSVDILATLPFTMTLDFR